MQGLISYRIFKVELKGRLVDHFETIIFTMPIVLWIPESKLDALPFFQRDGETWIKPIKDKTLREVAELVDDIHTAPGPRKRIVRRIEMTIKRTRLSHVGENEDYIINRIKKLTKKRFLGFLKDLEGNCIIEVSSVFVDEDDPTPKSFPAATSLQIVEEISEGEFYLNMNQDFWNIVEDALLSVVREYVDLSSWFIMILMLKGFEYEKRGIVSDNKGRFR